MEPDEHITEFICGGAKSYGYTTNTGKIVIKQKGISLDYACSKILTFQNMRDEMVFKDESIMTGKKIQFKWDVKTKDIKNLSVERSIRNTIGEKRVVVGFDTLPYGYDNSVINTDIAAMTKKKKIKHLETTKQTTIEGNAAEYIQFKFV